MQLYMAPMEGITGYVFRRAYHKCFCGIDRFFAPFIMSKKLNQREIRDILPENNEGMELIPQILTNRAEDFLDIARAIHSYGYDQVNLNLGCPSPTVTSRKRGSGFLEDVEALDHFLEEIFEKSPVPVSIKTRIGVEGEDEWETILSIYDKYPLTELIVHPRLKTDMYKPGTIHREAYALAVEKSRHTLCYNGDIRSVRDFLELREQFPKTERVMLGRGLLEKPWLAEEISAAEHKGEHVGARAAAANVSVANTETKKRQLLEFHQELLEGYQDYMSGDKNTLFKMKELWAYLGKSFTNPEKYLKKIRKSQKISEYQIWVNALFREQELRTEEG